LFSGICSRGRHTLSTVSSQSMPSLVSCEWLHEALGFATQGSRHGAVVVVDCTWFLPNSPFANPDITADAAGHFQQCHIPTASFLDIDAIGETDFTTIPLGHNLPTMESFQEAAASLGINKDSKVVVYDQHGIFSAPRFWYTMKAFGHNSVAVLDGGLPLWLKNGFPVQAQAKDVEAPSQADSDQTDHVRWGKNRRLQWSIDDVRRNLESKDTVMVDMRPAARFSGSAPEPRAGVRSGHIPGSKNVPFASLLQNNKDGSTTLRPKKDLQECFLAAGVDVTGPIVLSCGSGMTACIGRLALDQLGAVQTAVYDGSWTEWGSQADTPVATGTGT